jgi:hypothetical protein
MFAGIDGGDLKAADELLVLVYDELTRWLVVEKQAREEMRHPRPMGQEDARFPGREQSTLKPSPREAPGNSGPEGIEARINFAFQPSRSPVIAVFP